MGTTIHVELWHTNKNLAQKNIQRVFKEMVRIDSLMSPFKKDSELSLINQQAEKRSSVLSGKVTKCTIISSELNSKSLERRLISRVKFFRFATKDVATITVTMPVDLLPS